MAQYNNPQQEPGMERRLLIIFVLTFVVILLFQPLLKKYFPQPPEQKPATPQQAKPPTQPPIPLNATSGQAAGFQPALRATSPQARRQAANESQTVVEHD